MKKTIAIAAIVFGAIAVLVGTIVLILPLFLGSLSTSLLRNPLCFGSGSAIRPVAFSSDGEMTIGDSRLPLTEERLSNAAYIYSAAQDFTEVDREDVVTAFMTAMQESTLINHGWLGDRNDHNSLNFFQMQFGLVNSKGEEHWGTPAQLMNPVYSSHRWFQEMIRKVPSRRSMTKNDVAQRIQVSAYPNAYAKWEDEAEELLAMFEQAQVAGEDELEQEDILVAEEDTSIAVIGDSITVGTNSYMFDDLLAAGYTDIRVDAQGARSMEVDSTSFYVPTTSGIGPTLAEDQALVSGLTAIRNLRAEGYDPTDWLVLLGTNDIGLISNDPEQAATDVRRLVGSVMTELGPDKRVMWLTIWNQENPLKVDLFNQSLSILTSEYSNLLVADWASLARSNPEWLADNVHYTSNGYKERSSFIGKATGLLKKVGELGTRVLTATNIGSGLTRGCNFGTGVEGQTFERPAAGTPIEQMSNPEIARVARGFEQIVNADIKYGAPRPKWYEKGRRGNFGHGNKEQWLSELYLGPDYQSLDCSGLTNMVIYLAYSVDYNGCSHSYKNLVLDGQQVTTPVMERGIDPSLLQLGDFIIKHDQGCLGGDLMNHIVVVTGIRGDQIEIAESRPGIDGFGVSEYSVQWFNDNWDDLVVSRWIGPGAVTLSSVAVIVPEEVEKAQLLGEAPKTQQVDNGNMPLAISDNPNLYESIEDGSTPS